MVRILITAGLSYIGSHCVKALWSAGHEGIVFDDLTLAHRALRDSSILVTDSSKAPWLLGWPAELSDLKTISPVLGAGTFSGSAIRQACELLL